VATSKKVASEAGHELKTEKDKKEKSVAASALSQRKSHKAKRK